MTQTFGLFIVGDEILSGKRIDKHLPKVIELLAARGLALRWAQYLGDDRADITAALRRSFAGPDVVLSTGGIGATPDDHTRQAAAAALGVELELHPEAQRLIEARIAEMNQGSLSAAENRQRMKMGEFPRGSSIIPNPYNKIPGFSIGRHFFVPGFPVMAWPMLEWVLETHFRDAFHWRPQAERSMLVFGSAESTLTPLMEQIEMSHPGVKVFSLPSVGEEGGSGKRARRHIELGVKGPVADLSDAYDALRAGVQALGAEFDEDP
ncbi:MAG: molybdopterin-binding protein [Burkholderiaceae bacterium]|jgi:molybdopterin-biosynthesis enzyme MoeA-like protein